MLSVLLLVSAGSALAADSASFVVTATPLLDKPIPSRFIGLSIEVGSAPNVFLTGGLGGPPRPSLATLLNTLREAAGDEAGASVRVGGNSADESAWM